MSADRPTLMRVLTAAGYRTHAIGKMHFQPPRRSFGFQSMEISEEIPRSVEQDDFLCFLQGRGFAHVHEPHGIRSDMYYIPQVSQLPAPLHTTAWTADRAAAFLRGHDQRQPFFLWMSFIRPHPPFAPPVPWNKLYRTVDMPKPFRPEGYQALQTWWMRHQNRYKYRESGPDDTLARTIRAAYLTCISFIDHELGRVLRVLATTGLAERTLGLFTADHGELLGDYASWGKRSFLDPAARVPLIARWPGRLAPGGVCSAPVSLLDLMPTALGAAGIDPAPCGLDGVPLTEERRPPCVFGQLDRGARGTYMVTDDRHKYFYSAPDDREFLFDLADHASGGRESRNLAAAPDRRQTLEALRATLIGRLRRDGYEEPLDGEHWRCYPPPPEPETTRTRIASFRRRSGWIPGRACQDTRQRGCRRSGSADAGAPSGLGRSPFPRPDTTTAAPAEARTALQKSVFAPAESRGPLGDKGYRSSGLAKADFCSGHLGPRGIGASDPHWE